MTKDEARIKIISDEFNSRFDYRFSLLDEIYGDFDKQYKNEQENNIDSEMAKSLIIKNSDRYYKEQLKNHIEYIKQLEELIENKLLKNELFPKALIEIAKQNKKVNHYNKELDVTFTIRNGYHL